MPLNIENAYSLSILRALKIGNKRIDDEHVDLFEAFEKLQKAVQSEGVESAEFSEIFSRIGQDLARHIDHEESLFVGSGMPVGEVYDHIRAHVGIVEDFAKLNMELMQGGSMDETAVILRVRHWILNHLLCYDLKLRPYISDELER